MKEIIEEYGGMAVGVLIGGTALIMMGIILYRFLSVYFNYFASVLYG